MFIDYSMYELKVDNILLIRDTVIFAGPPLTEQILWPRHCEQDTWGAQLHDDIKVAIL